MSELEKMRFVTNLQGRDRTSEALDVIVHAELDALVAWFEQRGYRAALFPNLTVFRSAVHPWHPMQVVFPGEILVWDPVARTMHVERDPDFEPPF
jgi:hypothetical protein